MLNTTSEFIANAQPHGVSSPAVGPDAVPIAMQVNG